jgi:hypothetical protein
VRGAVVKKFGEEEERERLNMPGVTGRVAMAM